MKIGELGSFTYGGRLEGRGEGRQDQSRTFCMQDEELLLMMFVGRTLNPLDRRS